MHDEATKSCIRCGEVKPLSEFYRRPTAADGRRNDCKDCRRAADRAYGAAHRDERAEYQRRHYAAAKEKRLAWQRDYYRRTVDQDRARKRARYLANLDAERAAGVERARQWAAANPSKAIAKARRNAGNRRARMRLAFVESVDPLTVYERDNWTCRLCGLPVEPSTASVDHIIPLARGGKHAYENVQTAHRRCNFSKGARLLTTEVARCESR